MSLGWRTRAGQRLVWPSSGSHFNAKLQARHATLALAPRMIDSREAEFVEYTARARGKVSELLTFVRYGHSWPYVVRLPDGLGTIHLAYGKRHLEGSLRYHQGSFIPPEVAASYLLSHCK